jgi:ABC-type glycerol-3-phosphate transport system substrate-binding protein
MGAAVVPKAAAGGLAEQEIVVGVWASPHAEAVKRLSPIFTDLTGKKVTVRVESPASEAANAKKLAMWQAKGDDWDVVHDSNGNFLLSGPAGFFEPLDAHMRNAELVNYEAFNVADWPKALLDTYTHKGQLHILPFESSTYMTFARKDLLAEHGVTETPPLDGWDWDKTIEVARTVQDSLNAKGVKDVAAMAHIFRAANAGTMWQQTVYSYGHVPWKEDLTPAFNAEPAVEATQMLHDLMFKHKVVSQGSMGYQYQEMLEVVNNGRAVLPIQWNASAETNELPEKSQSAGKLVYANFPYHKSAGPNVKRVRPGAHGLGVNPHTKKKDAALEFVFWYHSPDVARDYVVNGGGVSGRKSLLTDPKIVEKRPWFPAMFRGYETYFAYPQTPFYQYTMDEFVSKALHEAWAGQISVKQALDKAQDQAVAYLKEKGTLK